MRCLVWVLIVEFKLFLEFSDMTFPLKLQR